jgi:RNA polymerase sigma factor (sigma-70 family)
MDEKSLFTIPVAESPSNLVSAACRGDTEAFALLVKGCERTLYRVSRTVLQNDQDCADAVQEALSRAWLRLKTLREPAYFRTWLTRILLNECYRQLKHGRRAAMGMEPVHDRDCEGARDDIIDLKDAMATLPAQHRSALMLYHVEDMSVEEIARVLNVPAGTVKSRLARARARLATQLRPKEEAK